MKKITPKKILLLLFFTALAMTLFIFSKLLYFPDSEIRLDEKANIKLSSRESISQKFVANRDGLSKVQFLADLPRGSSESDIEIELARSDCKDPIVKGRAQKPFLKHEKLLEFRFPIIEESKEKEFCLNLKFEPGSDAKKPLKLYSSDEIFEGSLSFSIRPAYKNDSVWKDLNELNQRISQYKPFFLKHYFLWTIVISFLVLSAGLVVLLILL